MVCKEPAILIVDDDKAICGLVCESLAEEGYQCEVASSAEDALTKLRKHSFDVALLDIRLPGKSGMDLLKSLDTLFQATAIVMMTAVKDFETAVKAMQLGASDYVVKPFTIDKLNASIITALKNRKGSSSVVTITQTTGNPVHCKNTRNQPLIRINAIAFGVDAQVDYYDFHSQIVTERTVSLALQLGFPDTDIKKWVDSRKELYSKRDSYIRSISSKLERNPIAQVMLGLVQTVSEFPESEAKQN